MKLKDLDHHATGNKPITNCLRWLRTCLAACTSWNDDQRAAAQQAVEQAEELLATELSPNVTPAVINGLLTPVKREASPVRELVDDLGRCESIELQRDQVMRLALWEGALLAKVEAMEAVLADVSRRVFFINGAKEMFWNAGTEERPHWVPDWRREIALMEAARHGADFREPDERPTMRWNDIPEEFRPGHANEGRKRLYELHLAWLNYREAEEESGRGGVEMTRLLRLKEDMQRVFEKRKEGVPA